MASLIFDHYMSVLEKLANVRIRSGYAVAMCPAHNDRNPSLTVRISRETGNLLMKCHAGCNLKDICREAGIQEKELFATSNAGMSRTIQSVYNYTDAKGGLLYQVVRYMPKSFRQRRPDGKGGWIWNLEGVERVLYDLPRLLDQSTRAQPIWLVEGEKCAEAVKALDLVATTSPGGAGKWLKHYAEVLRGRHVVIVPDNDEAGLEHADTIARQVRGVAASVKVVELPCLREKEDIADFISNAFDAQTARDALVDLAAHAPLYAEGGSILLLGSRLRVAETRVRLLINELTTAIGKTLNGRHA